MIPEGKAD